MIFSASNFQRVPKGITADPHPPKPRGLGKLWDLHRKDFRSRPLPPAAHPCAPRSHANAANKLMILHGARVPVPP